MPSPDAYPGSLAHPHQIEIQEFDWYARIIDARSRAAFAEDHLPGAVCVPAQGSAIGTQAELRLADGELPVADPALAAAVQGLQPGQPVLVYCDRGGLDSEHWAQQLRLAGLRVDVLPGGWPNYRRWVQAALTTVPPLLSWRVLEGQPAGGLTAVLSALQIRGQQVVDLADLAGQRYLPGISFPSDPTPSQSAFESRLVARLRRLDGTFPVWVRNITLPDGLHLPRSLGAALSRAPLHRVRMSLHARALNWLEKCLSRGENAEDVMQAVAGFVARHEQRPLADALASLSAPWSSAVRDGGPIAGLAVLLAEAVDPHAGPGAPSHDPGFPLDRLSGAEISTLVESWLVEDQSSP